MLTMESVAGLRRALAGSAIPDRLDREDYQIAAVVGDATAPTFLARARSGSPAFLIPLEAVPPAAGRRGGGFSLVPAGQVAFKHEGRRWEQPAAVLECTDVDLVETFLVLVVDLVRRVTLTSEAVKWTSILAWVEEWQTLLARRNSLTSEQELGLWGELWLISKSTDPDPLVAGWRGPERESLDFFVNGIAVEVKTSRNAHVHHVAQSQIDRPAGAHPAYLLSIWAGVDPVGGVSVKQLAEKLLSNVSDPPALMKHMALMGYVPRDSDQYQSRYVALEPASWFRAEDVPRVREVDPGVSNIRYVVHLDTANALPPAETDRLWRALCGAGTFRANHLCD